MYLTITASIDGTLVSSTSPVSKIVGTALTRSTENAMKAAALQIKAALDKLYTALADKHGQAWPSGTTADSLSVRSGAGLRSIKDSIQVTGDADEVTGVITTGNLTVHETGAVITPKRAQYLTVPLTPALNSQGLPLRASAREWDNTFIATSRRGNLIIFQKQTGGKIIPLYLLRKSVTLPPRLGMSKLFEDMVPYFERKTIEAMERAFFHG